MKRRTGISNRETADEEARERREHPPLDRNLPPVENVHGAPENPEDLAREVHRPDTAADRNVQLSKKEGLRSGAQKETESRAPDRPMPATRKVAGAFGRERRRA